MWCKLESARSVLLGQKVLRESGRGVRLLLFENGDAVEEHDLAKPERLRLAPEASVVRVDQQACAGRFRHQIEQVRERVGPVHVVGYPFPIPERLELATIGRAEQVAISDKHLAGSTIIAATSSDGTGFPASSPVALAVGVCDAGGQPIGELPHGRRMPALCVPETACRLPVHSESPTARNVCAAAVYIVSDLAALWVERLLAEGHLSAPSVVRAALLASSVSSTSRDHPVSSAHVLADNVPVAVAYDDVRTGQTLTFSIEPSGSGPVRIAAVPSYIQQPGQWAVEAAEVTLRADGASDSGPGWAIIETQHAGSSIRVEVSVEGPVNGVAIVATAARECVLMPSRSSHRKPQIIVGISVSHDASACLLRDGRLECAIQLERITRVKRDGRPFLHSRAAVDYCLAALHINERDVDYFAFNIQNLVPEQVGLSHPLFDDSFDLFDPFDERVVFVSHHLAHAFAAFFSSPFHHSAVFVADGSGGSVIDADDLLLTGPEFRAYLERKLPTPRPPYHVQSSYRFDADGYSLVEREVARSFHPMCGSSSLGETYASVSQYVFGEWQEGGKLMGLAPYGHAEQLSETLLTRDDEGKLQFSSNWKRAHRHANNRLPPLQYRHLAARVQRDLEEALIERVRDLIARTGQRNVAYAGGVALNSVANQRILCQTGVEQLYVMPASHDAGISLGAAAAAHFLSTGRTKGEPVAHDFHGHAYGPADIERAIEEVRSFVLARPYNTRDVVDRLVSGQTIGWFDGGAEFGPRALGHRSILAAPFDKAMWAHLNQRVKYREEFRPYAPVVPREAANEYFEMGPDPDSPFMLRVVKVRPAYRDKLGAVTHVDGTARVQTVDQERTPRWHELLLAFGERTGVPILVNTSMNVRGEPIVETPAQALEMLLSTHLDAVVLGEQIVEPERERGGNLEDLLIARAPKVELEAGTSGPASFCRLVCRARGEFSVPLPMSMFLLLSEADGRTPVGELLNRFAPQAQERDRAITLLRQLLKDRLLLRGAPPSSTNSGLSQSRARTRKDM